MLRYFNKTCGAYIETIAGQKRLAYANLDEIDFYDLIEICKKGVCPGSEIRFYDFENGNVYVPFEKKRNTIYGVPVYVGGFYYFLQGDYDKKKITLYRYLPEEEPEVVTVLSMKEVPLYNLQIIGSPVHIISEDERFTCFFPQKFSFPKKSNESGAFIADGRVYFDAWVEEDWDEERNQPGDRYKYYNMVIVRDYEGNIISEEVGSLHQAADGTWWIA
ncbi:hypothetical protein AALA24_10680 [Anaerovoracaceae bacterium 42-11]